MIIDGFHSDDVTASKSVKCKITPERYDRVIVEQFSQITPRKIISDNGRGYIITESRLSSYFRFQFFFTD